jgi:hypothetical protein
MAAYVELFMDQGTTFNNIINLTDDTTNTPINVSSYTITSQLRRSYYSTKASANLTCTILNASNGEISLSMTAANTANLRAGRYLFDVKTIDQDSVTSRVLEGVITVTPSITKV